MALNGDEQVEYTQEYETQPDYTQESAEFQELIGLGLDEQVARELDELFQTGEWLNTFIVFVCDQDYWFTLWMVVFVSFKYCLSKAFNRRDGNGFRNTCYE